MHATSLIEEKLTCIGGRKCLKLLQFLIHSISVESKLKDIIKGRRNRLVCDPDIGVIRLP